MIDSSLYLYLIVDPVLMNCESPYDPIKLKAKLESCPSNRACCKRFPTLYVGEDVPIGPRNDAVAGNFLSFLKTSIYMVYG